MIINLLQNKNESLSTIMSYDPLLTRRQVADLLSVHPETIKRMEKRGEIAAVRLNSRNVRYRASEIDALIARATVPRPNAYGRI